MWPNNTDHFSVIVVVLMVVVMVVLVLIVFCGSVSDSDNGYGIHNGYY